MSTLPEKVNTIVKFLDADGNGIMDEKEIRVFVADLTNTPLRDVPEDHPEVQDLAGQTTADMEAYLLEHTNEACAHVCIDSD